MIGLVDYGLGNIQAFANIYRRLGIEAVAVSTPDQVRAVQKLILPGVGAFDWAMQRLNGSGLRDALDEAVLDRNVAILGVCVGMQVMAQRSEEGRLPGLGWVNGAILRLEAPGNALPLPHMGWNDVEPSLVDTLFKDIKGPRYYFLHSFHLALSEPDCILASTQYGQTFTSAVRQRNIFGTQFHPEKSHRWGIELLKNFAELELS